MEAVAMDVETQLEQVEPVLRRAFVARYGWPLGLDVTAEVMAWAWEHRNRLPELSNPAGYLYRVGTTRSRRLLRWQREQGRLPLEISSDRGESWSEPQLPAALNRLQHEERSAVVLVHCFQWTYLEVADLLEVPVHTVRNRVHRGLQTLRSELGAKQ